MRIGSRLDTRVSHQRHDVGYWLTLVAVCAAFWVMNTLTTLKEDDLGFTLVDGEWTSVRSLADVLRSMRNHYWATNGRVADVVALLFCAVLGKTAFNVCNAVVFGVMAHLVSLLATGRRSVLAVLATATVVGTCYPVPGETMLWLAGSCNYLWAVTASLLLVRHLLRHSARVGWLRLLPLAVGAAIAGGFNEATSLGFMAGLTVYYLCHRRLVDRTVAVALTGYLLGVALIVSSPAAWQRAAGGDIVLNLSAGELISSRWLIFTERVRRFVLPVAALLAGLIALTTRRWREAARSSVWSYVLVALALVMLALGQMHERAYAPLVTVSLIVILRVADKIIATWVWPRRIAVGLCLMLTAFTWGRGIVMLGRYKAFDDATVSEIKASPAQAVLLERQFDGYSRFIKPMNYCSTNYFAHEVVYRSFYQKENVQFVSDSVYHRYRMGRLLEGAVRLPLRSDRPDLIDSVLAIPGGDYMAVVLHTTVPPATFQTARCYFGQPGAALSPAERERRKRYGLVTDYSPCGFYPLRYQGKILLIFPAITPDVVQIVFPLELGLDSPVASIFP